MCEKKKDMYIEDNNEYYVVVKWPNVQELMGEDWFSKEAILDIIGTTGKYSYFVPIIRFNDYYNAKINNDV